LRDFLRDRQCARIDAESAEKQDLCDNEGDKDAQPPDLVASVIPWQKLTLAKADPGKS